MATIRIPIMGIGTNPDDTGNTFLDRIDNQLTMTNVKDQLCMVMNAPAGGGDTGFHGSFKIPKNFVGTPKIIVTGIIDGTPASTMGFGMTLLGRADTESIDTAYESEATVTKGTDWTGYSDESMIELSFTPTGTLAVDDTIVYFFYREDGADDSTINFLLTSLEFEYSDA